MAIGRTQAHAQLSTTRLRLGARHFVAIGGVKTDGRALRLPRGRHAADTVNVPLIDPRRSTGITQRTRCADALAVPNVAPRAFEARPSRTWFLTRRQRACRPLLPTLLQQAWGRRRAEEEPGRQHTGRQPCRR